jgi:hypothetical protein
MDRRAFIAGAGALALKESLPARGASAQLPVNTSLLPTTSATSTSTHATKRHMARNGPNGILSAPPRQDFPAIINPKYRSGAMKMNPPPVSLRGRSEPRAATASMP